MMPSLGQQSLKVQCLCSHCRLEPAQLRVAQSASSMVPPLPLTLGTLKEKQAYERELRTVTVGASLSPAWSLRASCTVAWSLYGG